MVEPKICVACVVMCFFFFFVVLKMLAVADPLLWLSKQTKCVVTQRWDFALKTLKITT